MKSSVNKRKISNEEFETAYSNIDNKKIINSFLKKYSNVLSYEDIYSCGMIALWKCLQLHDNTKQKFTTSLYRFMTWECMQNIVKNNKKPHISINNNQYGYLDETNLLIDDIIQQLDTKQQKTIKDFLYNKKPISIKSLKLVEKKIKDLVYS